MRFNWLLHPLKTFRRWWLERERRRYRAALAYYLHHMEAREQRGDADEDLERHRIALEDAATRGDFTMLTEWTDAPRQKMPSAMIMPARVLPSDMRASFFDPAAWWFFPLGDFAVQSPPERAEGLERRQHWQGEITRALRARLDPAATRPPLPPRGAYARLLGRLALFARLDDAPPPGDLPALAALARRLAPLPARDERFERTAHSMMARRYGASHDYHTAEYLDRHYLRLLTWIGDDAEWSALLVHVWRDLGAGARVAEALDACSFFGARWNFF